MRLSALAIAAAIGLSSCGGSSERTLSSDCSFTVASTPQSLTSTEVDQILAQAADVARQLNQQATIAVVDRVGNVLGVYRMAAGGINTEFDVTLRTGLLGTTSILGLENRTVPSALAAISKAVTGAYLSSSGNAFSTRTAGFIIQQHFVPGVQNTGAGPLYGVQFSQLPCGDLVQKGASAGIGPRRSPLGLAGDPGGFPLYKNGRVVGGIGVVTRADAIYGIDLNPQDTDQDLEEIIAQSATTGFAAPECIRANRITAGGVTLRFSDSDAGLVTPRANQLSSLPAGLGNLQIVNGYRDTAAVIAGAAYGEQASGFIAATSGPRLARAAVELVTAAGAARFPASNSVSPTTAAGGLTNTEVESILLHAVDIANAARAQIRRPLNSPAEVTISVVDTQGNILGILRTPDAPLFGTDVSLQKARTAVFFSKAGAATQLIAEGLADPYLTASQTVANDGRQANLFFATYIADQVFDGGRAFTGRAIGNIHRPYFPDGITNQTRGPLSRPFASWSPFNVGLQLDLVATKVLANLIATPDARCTAQDIGVNNGIQIFPGSVPIYRGSSLIGGIGVSGDGVDQDDMIAFLAVYRASQEAGATVGNAPVASRSDRLAGPTGDLLRYVQCPQSPFLNSSEQDVCSGR